MKKLLLILLCLPMIGFGQDNLALKNRKNIWPQYITDLAIGIDVYHSSEIVYAKKSNRENNTLYPYILEFGTTVMAINQDLEIIEFGAFSWEEGKWVQRNIYNRPFNKDEFIKWYHCNDNGMLYKGFKYSDNKNYLGQSNYLDGSTSISLWYFIGENDQGKRYVGAKEVYGKLSLQ